MIVELLTVGSMAASGMMILAGAGLRDWRVLPLFGFIVGLCLHVIIGFGQVLAFLRVWPVATWTLSVVVGAAWLIRRRRGGPLALSGRKFAAALVAVTILAAGFHALDHVNHHVDSHEHLAMGSMLVSGSFPEGRSFFQLQKRTLVVALIHAPANLVGEYFLSSVMPMLAIATLLVLAWFVETSLRPSVSPGAARWVALLSTLLLLTTNRFVHNSFYINGHLIVAALVLVVAASLWRDESTAGEQIPGVFIVQAVALVVLVWTRAETGLLAALVIAPAILDGRRPWRQRAGLGMAVAGGLLSWNGFLALQILARGGVMRSSVAGMLAFAVLLLAALPLLRLGFITRHRRTLLICIEAGLWLVLAALVVRNRRPFRFSLEATVDNTLRGVGGWGVSLAVLAVLCVGVLILFRARGLVQLRFPLSTFLPLAFLLAYLRGGAYRAHPADSLNRMIIHVVPLAIFYVAVAAGTELRRRRSRTPVG